jgi:hypothetical protein
MAVIPKQDPPSPAVVETVQEIMRIYRSLPPRPSLEELEAATSVLKTVNTEEQMKLEELSKQVALQDVPEELFSVLQQVRRTMVLFQSYEQRWEALHLVELDKMFQNFDDLIQRASGLVSGDTQNQKHVVLSHPFEKFGTEIISSDESLVKKKEGEESEDNNLKGLARSSSAKATTFSSGYLLFVIYFENLLVSRNYSIIMLIERVYERHAIEPILV